jgi:APA family basic amino acid/polyamine antiporter
MNEDTNNNGVHASGLLQRLGLFSAFLVVVSSMIGSGVFKKVGPMSAELGNAWYVLLAWVVAGAITWFGAISNAEVAGLIAEPGGQYVYFKRMYGRLFAFFYGWTGFAVVQSSTMASLGFVFAMSVNQLIPLPRLDASWEAVTVLGYFHPFENFGVKLVTIGLLLTLTVINLRGVQYGKWVINAFTLTVIAGICFVIFFGLTSGVGSMDNLAQSVPLKALEGGAIGWMGAFFAAMMQAFWAYEGWNNLGFLGGEVKNPHRTIPLSLTFGVLFVIGVYVLINFSYLYVLPVKDFIALQSDENAIAAVAVANAFLPGIGATLITVLILIATFGSTNNSILTSPRVYFAMARDGLFFRKAGELHPVNKVPSGALLMQSTWACVLVLSGSFDQLTDMLVFAAFIFYGLGAFGLFVLRKKMPTDERKFRVPGYPFVPGFFVAFCAVLVFISLFERPLESFTGLALIALGYPFYLWFSASNKPNIPS